MRQRLIGAAVLVPVVIVLFLLGAPWLTLGIAVLAGFAAWETARLVQAAGMPASTWLPVVAAPVGVLGLAWAVGPGGMSLGWLIVAPWVAAIVIASGIVGLRLKDPKQGFAAWMGTAFATLFPSLLAFVAAFIGVAAQRQDASIWGIQLDTGRMWVLVLVATVWTLDSAAYVGGRLHGQGRFMNHISPNKTWSGVAVGTAAGVLICMLLFIGIGLSILGGVLLGIVITVAAQAGDLAESMLKRAAGAKDSGNVLPGHGGVLDRVDSFLFAAPAMYASIVVIGTLRANGLI